MNRILVYLAIGCVGLAAQTPGKAISGIPVPDVNERTLQETYHIAPTKEGLLVALQHPSPSVRNFAATKLAESGDKSATRPILAALAAETVESSKIILATSASKLGAAERFDALKSMCSDRSSSPEQRMNAAHSMVLLLGRQECLSDILEVLWAPAADHPRADAMALGVLSGFKQIPPIRLDEIRNLSTVYVKSQEWEVRLAASQLITVLGGPWAISQLQAALDVERDENVRRFIASNLGSLQK